MINTHCFVVLACTSYIGVAAVMSLVKMSGAVAAVATTSGRKAFSMIISFVFFPKHFTMMYIYGFIAVFSSIGELAFLCPLFFPYLCFCTSPTTTHLISSPSSKGLSLYSKHPKECREAKEKIMDWISQISSPPRPTNTTKL
jgi:hypothetical protein